MNPVAEKQRKKPGRKPLGDAVMGQRMAMRMTDHLRQQFTIRGTNNDLSDGVRKCAVRYFRMLDEGRSQLRRLLKDPKTVKHLVGVYRKGGETALMAEAIAFTSIQKEALLDCIERYVKAVDLDVSVPIDVLLK